MDNNNMVDVTVTPIESETAEEQLVGSVDDFEIGKAKRLILNETAISVWRLEDGFYAIEDSCPHAGASLTYGECEADVVACPRHGAQFDIRTGRVVSLPAVHGLMTYVVSINNGQVYVSPDPIEKQPDILRF